MRILAIHNFLDNYGGAEISFLEMVLGLKRKGHAIDVLVLNISEDFKNKLEDSALRLYNLNFKQWNWPFLDALAKLLSKIIAYCKFRKFIKIYQKDYDLAFVHHFFFSPLALPLLGIPKIYYCHEPPRIYYEPATYFYKSGLTRPINMPIFFLEKMLDRYCVRRADMIMANSDYTAGYIRRVYGIAAKTNYLGVNTDGFDRISDIKKENMVLSVGPLHPLKAHDFVIRSLARIAPEFRPKLVIAGRGSDKEKEGLLELARSSGVDIEIKQAKERREMAELYNKAVLTAVASIMEPFGLAAVESMACYTPVVAVNEAGLRETVSKETGILTDRDEAKFASAIEYLIRNPAVAEDMGRKARKMVEEDFTWARTVKQLEEDMAVLLNSKCNIDR